MSHGVCMSGLRGEMAAIEQLDAALAARARGEAGLRLRLGQASLAETQPQTRFAPCPRGERRIELLDRRHLPSEPAHADTMRHDCSFVQYAARTPRIFLTSVA